MTNVELKKYLAYVLETEKNVLILKKTIAKMEYYINNLGVERIIPKPSKTRLSLRFRSDSIGWGLSLLSILTGAGCGWLMPGTLSRSQGFFWGLFHPNILYILLGVLIGFIPVAIGLAITILKNKSKDKKIYKAYKMKIDQEHAKATNELNVKNNALAFHNKTKEQLAATQQVLNRLYSLNILHRKYQYNIYAIASFYDYFDTGRCTKLEGDGGAYDKYESEALIKGGFDLVNENLDKIYGQMQSNQHALIQAIKSADEKIERLAKTSEITLSYAKATAQTSQIIAYNTDVAARNTEFLKWVEIYKMARR